MVEIHFSINIDAPKEKVWDFMIGKDTYSLWADVFMKGSYFVGDWSEGSKIQFLAPFKGQMSGMLSRVKKNRPDEFISLETEGVVYNGQEDTTSKEAREWSGTLENYTFKEVDGKTELQVDLSADVVNQEMIEMSEKTWPDALQKLKKLIEKS